MLRRKRQKDRLANEAHLATAQPVALLRGLCNRVPGRANRRPRTERRRKIDNRGGDWMGTLRQAAPSCEGRRSAPAGSTEGLKVLGRVRVPAWLERLPDRARRWWRREALDQR